MLPLIKEIPVYQEFSIITPVLQFPLWSICLSRENIRRHSHKVGRQWKFKISEVDEWIRSGVATEKTNSC